METRTHQQIASAAEDFRMADPAAEGNSLLDPKRSRELLEAFRSGPSPTTVNRAKSLRKSGAAPRKARSQAFRGTRPPTKISSSLAPGSGLRESSEHTERPMPGSGTKNSLSRYAANSEYVWDEASYDRRRMAIGGPGKRQKSVQIPEDRRSIPFVSRAG